MPGLHRCRHMVTQQFSISLLRVRCKVHNKVIKARERKMLYTFVYE